MKIQIEDELTERVKRVGMVIAVAAVLLGGAVAYAQGASGGGADHVNRALISGLGTVMSQNGAWVSRVEHPATGTTVLTFASGAFSAPPTCVWSPFAGEVVGSGGVSVPGVPAPMGCLPATTTGTACQSRGASLAYDQMFSLVCVGR
jgi:hypothetical protein